MTRRVVLCLAMIVVGVVPASALDCDAVKQKIGMGHSINFIGGLLLGSEHNQMELIRIRANYVGKLHSDLLAKVQSKDMRLCLNNIIHETKDQLSDIDQSVSASFYAGYTFGLMPGVEAHIRNVYREHPTAGLTLDARMNRMVDDWLTTLGESTADQDILRDYGITAPKSIGTTTATGQAPEVSHGPEYDRCGGPGRNITIQLTPEQLIGAPMPTLGLTEVIIYGDLANNADIDAISNAILSQRGGKTHESRYYVWSRCGRIVVGVTYPSLTSPICGCTADGQGQAVAAQPDQPPTTARSPNYTELQRCCAIRSMLEFSPDAVCDGFIKQGLLTRESCDRVTIRN